MTYDDKIEKTEERLRDVIDTVGELTKDRFIASLYIRNMAPIDVDIRLAEVRRCLVTVHAESLRLAKLATTYNADFAVANNQRFTTAEKLFNSLRSSMATIRKQIHQGCPIIRKQPRNPNFKPSIFERSVLAKGCCARDLYDITVFDDNVQALYYEQQALFANVILSLSICHRVIKEEQEISQDTAECVKRLDDQCQRIINDLRGYIDTIKDVPESEIQKMIDQMGKEEYARQNFHKPTVEDMTTYAMNVAKQRGQVMEQPKADPIIFGSGINAQDMKLLCQHLDELRPNNRKMMSALTMRLFFNLCAGGKEDNPKKAYIPFLLNNYKGRHKEFPDWHAITSSKRKGMDMEAEQQKFNEDARLLIQNLKQNTQQTAS